VVARRADGSVWTWGSNQYGQQGNGSTTDRPTPVPGLSGVETVTAGRAYSAAL
jgi:alpha-tubulin suppressor-like RCC1 family protein